MALLYSAVLHIARTLRVTAHITLHYKTKPHLALPCTQIIYHQGNPRNIRGQFFLQGKFLVNLSKCAIIRPSDLCKGSKAVPDFHNAAFVVLPHSPSFVLRRAMEIPFHPPTHMKKARRSVLYLVYAEAAQRRRIPTGLFPTGITDNARSPPVWAATQWRPCAVRRSSRSHCRMPSPSR